MRENDGDMRLSLLTFRFSSCHSSTRLHHASENYSPSSKQTRSKKRGYLRIPPLFVLSGLTVTADHGQGDAQQTLQHQFERRPSHPSAFIFPQYWGISPCRGGTDKRGFHSCGALSSPGLSVSCISFLPMSSKR